MLINRLKCKKTGIGDRDRDRHREVRFMADEVVGQALRC